MSTTTSSPTSHETEQGSSQPEKGSSQPEKGSSLWKDAWIRLRKNKLAMAGFIVIALILIACFIVAPILKISGWDPNVQDLTNKFASPSLEHPLGTDQLGRDLLIRILDGGQISLLVALLATFLTVTFGVLYGSISGYIGGKIDSIMMRIVDGLLAMPFLIIVILFRELIATKIEAVAKFLVDTLGMDPDLILRFSNLLPLILAIAAFGWLTMGRIVRTQAATLSQQEFIEAARSLGLTHPRILLRHIIPNMLSPIIIYATLSIPSFILYESTLSFIGLGIEPPNSSWGILINEGVNFLETKPALILYPSLIFSFTLLSFNFLGDGLRDALDPKASKD